jgi:hypothetical protein
MDADTPVLLSIVIVIVWWDGHCARQTPRGEVCHRKKTSAVFRSMVLRKLTVGIAKGYSL